MTATRKSKSYEDGQRTSKELGPLKRKETVWKWGEEGKLNSLLLVDAETGT